MKSSNSKTAEPSQSTAEKHEKEFKTEEIKKKNDIFVGRRAYLFLALIVFFSAIVFPYVY